MKKDLFNNGRSEFDIRDYPTHNLINNVDELGKGWRCFICSNCGIVIDYDEDDGMIYAYASSINARQLYKILTCEEMIIKGIIE